MTIFVPIDRVYSSWEPMTELINPIKEKLLVGDNINNTVIEKISPYRSNNSIPGILIFDGRTFGRNDNGKTLYKCVPNDRSLPIFLVPYVQKKSSFSKNKVNKYVLFKFHEWDTQKHPIGVITNTLGNVDDFSVYCDYQLYCRDIHISVQKFKKIVCDKVFKFDNTDILIKKISEKYDLEDRTDMNIIAIDPLGSLDYDDALGIIELANGENILSVYITNVVILFEALELWDDFTNRITSIYLPDKKRDMLPAVLSEILCSLVMDSKSIVFAMDITLNQCYEIVNIEFKNCLISVTNNYIYESDTLMKEPLYDELKKCCVQMQKIYPYLDNITDSHDVVAYFMILMNHQCGEKLSNYKTGIYRNASLKSENESETSNIQVPDQIKQFIKYYKQTGGMYSNWDKQTGHKMIGKGLECYTQITSPIRRIVDLINMAVLQENENMLLLSDSAKNFINKWLHNIDNINTFTKNVKKVQNDCTLLKRSIDISQKNELLDGYIVDILLDNKYLIYIPIISLKIKIQSERILTLYDRKKFKLYTFMDETTFQKKIRLQIVD
tara:strand:- start:2050 stop:3711 length:1662 start_codon:yes stop_codon:yes gene_type:complete